MKLVKLTAQDGTRLEVNPEGIAFVQRSSAEKSHAEITFLHGQKILVRQTIPQVLQILGGETEMPVKAAAAEKSA